MRSGWGRAGLRRGIRFRGQALGAKAQRDERKRIDFAIGHEVLVGLETLEGVGRLWPPLASRLALEVTLAPQSLLDFPITVRCRCLLIGARGAMCGLSFAVGAGLRGARFCSFGSRRLTWGCLRRDCGVLARVGGGDRRRRVVTFLGFGGRGSERRPRGDRNRQG